jgi:hypothetical protein
MMLDEETLRDLEHMTGAPPPDLGRDAGVIDIRGARMRRAAPVVPTPEEPCVLLRGRAELVDNEGRRPRRP